MRLSGKFYKRARELKSGDEICGPNGEYGTLLFVDPVVAGAPVRVGFWGARGVTAWAFESFQYVEVVPDQRELELLQALRGLVEKIGNDPLDRTNEARTARALVAAAVKSGLLY